ncbi:MAG: peptide-methionine (R)-S-oxide reductase MsrB [Patescibacteria group bacterium]
MQSKFIKIILIVIVIVQLGFIVSRIHKNPSEVKSVDSSLTPAQYAVLKEGATERPFTSDLLYEKRKGTYVTADCNEPVFRSEQKFETGTGWPSFWAPIASSSVEERADGDRTEIISAKCKSHLGHVFNDAPQTPTGLRYCINGLALKFIPDTIQ